MGYIICFIIGAIVGLLASACCVIAGRDDEQNGRNGDV